MNKEEAKKQIDEVINLLEWRHGGWTDCVKNDRTTAHAIIDKIEPDHPKVKLPRDVGEELDEWMFDNKDRLVGRIGELIFDMMTHEPKLTNVFCFVGDSEENCLKVIDAYRYGWTAEKETLYNVKVPHAVNSYFKKIDANDCIAGDTFYVDLDEDLAQFTEAEIEHYDLQDCEKEEVTDDAD